MFHVPSTAIPPGQAADALRPLDPSWTAMVCSRALAALLLVLALPVIALVLVLMWWTTRRSGLVKQLRVGKEGHLFFLYGLESEASAPATGAAASSSFKHAGGVLLRRWVRRWGIDCWPQLLNVLKGEMALVGPQPDSPQRAGRLQKSLPGYRRRLAVLPGITGLAQIVHEGGAETADPQEQLQLDLEFVQCADGGPSLRVLLFMGLRWCGFSTRDARRITGLPVRSPAAGELVRPAGPAARTIPRVWQPAGETDRPLRFPRYAVNPSETRCQEIVNAFTVDVEDYFQVTAFEQDVCRSRWGEYPSRVAANTRRLLQILDEYEVRGTFFVLGWIAERYPELVRTIHRAGHEIGSHSYLHRLVYDLSPAEFRRDVRASRDRLQDILGEPVTVFRAPSFSITRRSLWALEILVEEGFTIDSSIFPVYHDRYGIPDAPRHLHRLSTAAGPLWEFPPSVVQYGQVNIPISGGGYFRLYPGGLSKYWLRRINRQKQPFVFYVHPWEIDPQQPRLTAGSAVSRCRHYLNLASTEAKLRRLLGHFRFATLSEVVAGQRLRAAITPASERPCCDSATA